MPDLEYIKVFGKINIRTYVLGLLVDRLHVGPDNVLKVLAGREVLVDVAHPEVSRLQQVAHVLDVVGRRDGEGLEVLAQVVAHAEEHGPLLPARVLLDVPLDLLPDQRVQRARLGRVQRSPAGEQEAGDLAGWGTGFTHD